MARKTNVHDAQIGLDLSQFHDRKMAVVVIRSGERCVFRGTAEFQQDDLLGNILRIRAADPKPSDPEVIISEAEFNGRIIPDFEYGCDFSFVLFAL